MTHPVTPHSRHTTSAGRFYPLGATPTPSGVNFALYSERASAVFVELYGHRSRHSPHRCHRVEGLHSQRLHVAGERPEARATLWISCLWRLRPRGRGCASTKTQAAIDPYAKALSGKVGGIATTSSSPPTRPPRWAMPPWTRCRPQVQGGIAQRGGRVVCQEDVVAIHPTLPLNALA